MSEMKVERKLKKRRERKWWIMFLTWSSFNNIRLLMMACMPVVIFYLIWLINTSESIRSEEGTLLDLICWPDGNAIPVIITLAAAISVIIEVYGLYQLFKAGQPKKEYDVTNGLFYYVWALIITIIIFLAIIFYSGLQSTIIRAKIKGGISKAMLRYATHLPSKVAIDRLQTRFHCCGRVSYEEWFYIPWYTVSNENRMDLKGDPGRRFVADNVPYSCCSMDVMRPCIHHGVTQLGSLYKYDPHKQLTIWKDGCEEKLIYEMMSVSWRFNTVMALIATAMIVQVLAMRYLHTAYKKGLHVGNQITCEAYILRSSSDVNESIQRPQGRRKVFRKRKLKLKHAKTAQWVTADYTGLEDEKSEHESPSSSELKAIDE